MDVRKVQMSGGSSYIVSLPKEWVVENKIHKNDSVGLVVQNDGTLLISPNITDSFVSKVWEYEVSAQTDRVYFLRCMIGAYISGYTSMKIFAIGKFPPFAMEVIREFTMMAVGQEVVSESENFVIIKDLLNPSEMPFKNTLQRMSVIVIKMHKDAMLSLKEGNASLAKAVRSRDNDVDRLHWLIARQCNLVLNNPTLSRKMGISHDDAVHYYLSSRIVERVGDHASRIAGSVIHLLGDGRVSGENGENSVILGIPNSLMEQIDSVNNSALGVFSSAIDAFFNGDIMTANSIISVCQSIDARCKEINSQCISLKSLTAVNVVSISDSVRRVADYSADICENVINDVIGRNKKM